MARRKSKLLYRSKRIMYYHGRKGHHPLIHTAANGRKYIMVRKKGGGAKRLYLKKGKMPPGHTYCSPVARHRRRKPKTSIL